jgi:acetylornithine/N-succinyldiaminopimelate aminotransferase
LATLSATDKEAYREGFGPRVGGFTHVAFGNLNELRAVIDDETAAILVEPVQGEGGVNVAPLDYLRALREVADEFELMLIFDEVQCGVGRTGKLWAHEWAGITPDIQASAKGLGGGFPVGAVMATEKAASGMKPGLHGSTYGGNPLACVAANAVLDVILEPGFLEHVDKTARAFWTALQSLPGRYPGVIEDVRGAGLLLGLKCAVPVGDLQTALRDEQSMLTVGAAENVLRLLPPLTIDESHVREAVDKIDAACAGLARHAA